MLCVLYKVIHYILSLILQRKSFILLSAFFQFYFNILFFFSHKIHGYILYPFINPSTQILLLTMLLLSILLQYPLFFSHPTHGHIFSLTLPLKYFILLFSFLGSVWDRYQPSIMRNLGSY